LPKKTFFNLPFEKRKRIIEALIYNFANKPYNDVDISEVAKSANVSKGSMYQYFEDKKDMYFYSIKMAFEDSLSLINKDDFGSKDFFELIKASLNDSWNFFKNKPNSYLLLERAFFYNDSPYREEVFETFMSITREILYDIIVKSQENGYIRNDIDAEIVLVFVEGVSLRFKQMVVEMAIKKGMKILDMSYEYIAKLSDDIISLLKEGLSPKN